MGLVTVVSLAFVIVYGTSIAEGLMPGGLTDEKIPSNKDHVQEIVETLSTDIRTQVAAKLASSAGNGAPSSSLENAPLTVLSYKTQVVAGTNYFIKLRVGKNFIFHVRVYQNLQNKLEIANIKGPQNESDELEYF